MTSASDPRNLLYVPQEREDREVFEDLLRRPGVRIQRILSGDHVTPVDKPHQQQWDEWVMVVRGEAELTLEGMGKWDLKPGDHMMIPAGVRHWVTHTEDPTIWLVVHLEP